MSLVPDWLKRINAYFGASEPRQSVTNSVALIVFSNQPFYPLYVYFLLGGRFWPVLLSWITAPLFAAVPHLGRKNAFRGALLLLVAGSGNTALCTLALGPASWVELFYLPCAGLALLLFSGRGRIVAFATLSAIVICGAVASRASGGSGLVTIAPEEYASLAKLHAFSVAGLLLVMVYISRRIWMPSRNAG